MMETLFLCFPQAGGGGGGGLGSIFVPMQRVNKEVIEYFC